MILFRSARSYTLVLAALLVGSAALQDADEGPKGTIIGIDLGTTYSCVGVMKDGRIDIIPNDQGNRITPSYVAFSGSQRLVGDAAKNQATLNPENTIFDAKRFIGRLYTDKSVKADAKLMPYEVVGSEDHKPFFQVTINGEIKKFSPEEVSAMILTKLKQDAESYLGKAIERAVVTVPAYFNDAQRYATRDAATIAGLHVERILNEPTAAAIAHGFSQDGQEEKHVLVFDLGGGTFDVTVLSMESGIFQVLATNGDTHLGGSDFDQQVMKYFMEQIKTKLPKSEDLDSRALQKLRKEVERVKRALSSQLQATLDIEELLPGFDFTETLTRAKFESLNEKLFQKTITPVKKVLEDAMLEINEIDEVVLVGGSTRIPKIQALMKEFFGGKEPYTGINPDEAVAHGAAVQASVLSGEGGDAVKDVMLLDVTPLSLGTETEGGIMDVLIKRGTTIPTEKSKTFYTVKDGQTYMTIDVYEGERSMVNKNHLLGLFELKGLPPRARGEVGVRITYKIDANGMLTVMAENLTNKDKKQITINPESGRLSQEDVDRMVKEAEEYAEQDKLFKSTVKARNELESLVYQVSSMLNGDGDEEKTVPSEDRKELLDSINEIMEWLEENQDATKDEFKSRYATLNSLSSSLLNTASSSPSDSYGDAGDDDDERDEL